MAKQVSLDVQAQNYWTARNKNGAEGLALLHKCIERTAQHRDWDALSRFLVNARAAGQGTRVTAIIRAAFGDKLTFKASKQHPTGGLFAMGWEGPFNLKGSNTYSVVSQAVKAGESWDSATLRKALGEVLPKPERKPRAVSPEAVAKAAKHINSYLAKLAADGFSIGDVLAVAERARLAEKVTTSDVEKRVVNGVKVYEPKF